jgi:(p)ppGpp synthase/HD superfamily hydrolase
MFDKAIFIAAREHLGTRDKGGAAYILHPMRIAMRLRTNDEELMSIAILHDVIEDSHLTFENLEAEGFSKRVIDALKLLTHQKGVSYEDYIDGMKNNLDALKVKREDLRDNSDITRLKGVSEKDVKRMVKYQNAFLKVTEYIKNIEDSNANNC